MGLATALESLTKLTGDVPSLVSALTSESWAISDEGRRQVMALVTQAISAREPIALRGSYAATIQDGVAIIPVRGPLSTRGSFFSSMLGFCDYESILRDLSKALADDEVKAVLFDVDSPGGLVSGAHDLALAIRGARGKKPTVAFAGGTCASAAYWIASACDQIYASPTALVGSIGCFAQLVDESELMAKLGIERHGIASKQSPLKIIDPADKDARARVQTWVTDQAAVFIGDVAAGRKRSAADVEAQFGRGDMFVGGAAQKAGLVDAQGDLDDAVNAALGLAAKGAKPSASPSARTAARAITTIPVAKTPARRAATTTRASSAKGKLMANEDKKPDIAKMREHAAALHGVAQDDHEDGPAMASALTPHVAALRAEMGDDDEGTEAKALVAQLGTSASAAAGALAALKAQSKEFAALKQRVESAEARSDKAELKAMLDEAMIEGRVSKAQRSDLEAKAKTHGLEFARAFVEMMPAKAAAAIAPSSERSALEHAKRSVESAVAVGAGAAAASADSLSATEEAFATRAIAAGRVKSIEEYAAMRNQYQTALRAPAQKDEV